MGRKSKLTESQWNEIEKRQLAGEPIRALAREFEISEGSIRNRGVTTQGAEIKAVAHQIVNIEERLALLPINAQVLTHSLANEFRAIGTHLSQAGKFGAMTAHRLSLIANTQVEKLDESAPLEENTEALKSIMAMTKGANDAAQIGTNLLTANKEALNAPPLPVRTINPDTLTIEQKRTLAAIKL